MDHRVQVIIATMKMNLHRELSLSDLAKAVNLSPWRICHLFKVETGSSPARFLKSLRMEKARALMDSSSLSVKEIMLQVGLGDKSHFERDFKKIYGVTPAQWCKASRSSLIANLDGKSFNQTNNKISHQITKSAIKSLLICNISCNIFFSCLGNFS